MIYKLHGQHVIKEYNIYKILIIILIIKTTKPVDIDDLVHDVEV